jgi:uncharacterized membrane protein YbhN (UPF0104 family)
VSGTGPDHSASLPATVGAAGSTQSRLTRRRAVLLVALVIPLALYLVTRREAFEDLQRLSLGDVLIVLLSQFSAQLLWNGAVLAPLRASLEKLGFWELLLVRSGGVLASYVVPVAGNVGVRMAYLRRRGLGYSDFVRATLLSNLLALFAAAILAVCAVVTAQVVSGSTSGPVLGLTGGIVALGALALSGVFLLPRFAGHPLLRRWRFTSASTPTPRRTIVVTSVLAFGRHVCNFLTFGLLYRSLSVAHTHLLAGGLVYTVTIPIRMVTITPGNLGVNEWVVALTGKLLSFDVPTGVLVALVFRGMSLAAQVLAATVAGAYLAAREHR